MAQNGGTYQVPKCKHPPCLSFVCMPISGYPKSAGASFTYKFGYGPPNRSPGESKNYGQESANGGKDNHTHDSAGIVFLAHPLPFTLKQARKAKDHSNCFYQGRTIL